MITGELEYPHRQRIVELAAASRLPAMYDLLPYVEAGGLISYGADLNEIWRRAAGYVHKILKGAKPADLPIEQPTKFDLVVNLKAAKALGLTIPHRFWCERTMSSSELRPNPRLERTAQQRCYARCWVPSSLRSSAAAQPNRWASAETARRGYDHGSLFD